MPNKIPRSPFTMCLSGSAKETELRIRNIFQWKKKRPPIIAFVAAILVIALCGSLVGFHTIAPEEPAPDDPVTETPPGVDTPVQKPSGETTVPTETDVPDGDIEPVYNTEVLSEEYDFDHDGTPEITSLVTASDPDSSHVFWYELQIKTTDGTLLRSEELYTSHAGWNSLFVCTLDGSDYLLRYCPTMYQGVCNYSYALFSLAPENGTNETVRQSNSGEFNTNFGSMTSIGFDGNGIADFMEEINELLSHSKLLFTTDWELEGIDPAKPYHDPSWLHSDHSSYWGYTYDESKTMRENIMAFGAAVNAAHYPETHELHSLTLDEDGEGDDSILLSIYKNGEGGLTGESTISAVLGSGKTLTRDFDTGSYWFLPSLQGAHLTSTDRQSVVVELPVFGSTYGAAQYYVLEVVDGALEIFDLNAAYGSLLDGSEIALRPDSVLSCVRIPVSVGTKWNATGWGTLVRDNEQWSFTEDGYFIDKRTLTVDGGMELTLALRGHNDNYGSGGALYYDQVQILHGETVLQTITEASFTPDGHCPFEYFNADAAFHSILTEDINFDGNTDFGIPCNTTHNDGHVWFLYDPRTRQYRFAFSLAGVPTIDKENKQVMEEWWDDSIYITHNTYEFNADGQLTLIDSETI